MRDRETSDVIMICLSRVDVWTYWFSVTDWSALYTHTLAGNLRSLYIVQLMVLYKYVCAPLVTVLWLHVLVYKIHNLPHSRDGLNTSELYLWIMLFWGWEGKDVRVGLLLIYLLFLHHLLWFTYVYLVNKHSAILFTFADMLYNVKN